MYPPGSYFLGQHPTGELCGSSFWIRFNQRYQRLRPMEEVYSAEIERSLLNVILANQAPADSDPPGIRYFAQLEGSKAIATNVVTCCESQGTRTFGALPEFLYSECPKQLIQAIILSKFRRSLSAASLDMSAEVFGYNVCVQVPASMMVLVFLCINLPRVHLRVKASTSRRALDSRQTERSRCG